MRCALLSSVAATSVRVLGRFHVAVWLCVLSGGFAEDLLDRAVLVALGHPILEVTMQLASRDSTLPTVNLSLDAHLVHGALLLRCSLLSVDKRASSSPSPLHIVWP